MYLTNNITNYSRANDATTSVYGDWLVLVCKSSSLTGIPLIWKLAVAYHLKAMLDLNSLLYSPLSDECKTARLSKLQSVSPTHLSTRSETETTQRPICLP